MYARKAKLKATIIATKRNKREDLHKRRGVLTKTTLGALILHNTHNISREQHTREKAKENRLPPQWAVRDFHHKQEVQAEVSQPGEQLPEHQEGWRQQPWPSSVMKERRKTKKKVCDLSGHET